MKNMKLAARKIFVLAAISAFAFGMTACGAKQEKAAADTNEPAVEVSSENEETENTETSAPEGTTEEVEKEDEAVAAKSIVVEVMNSDGVIDTFPASTDKDTLFDALSDVEGFSFDGYETDYGFYLTTINDVVADYENEGAYWAVYVNGEYGSYGLSEQPVSDGDTFTFVYEVFTEDDYSGDESEEKKFTVEVTDAEGNTTSFEGSSSAETLFDAIADIPEIQLGGEESEYGFYVTSVHGVEADYETDGAYWALYVNGEYGSLGVSEQPVSDGDTFAFVYEVYTAE